VTLRETWPILSKSEWTFSESSKKGSTRQLQVNKTSFCVSLISRVVQLTTLDSDRDQPCVAKFPQVWRGFVGLYHGGTRRGERYVYAPRERYLDDIRMCIPQVNINQRMNIFYFLDSLCDACQSIRPLPTPAGPSRSYVTFIERDLNRVVEYVTPEGRTGLPNLTSVKGVGPLESAPLTE
jgi:hypothetical protein